MLNGSVIKLSLALELVLECSVSHSSTILIRSVLTQTSEPLIAVQAVLDISDVPTGTAIIIFAQTLGGALFVSIGQNVFANKLVEGLDKYAPSVDPLVILKTGATAIQTTVDKADLAGVTLAYNDGLTMAFLVAAVMAATTIIGSGAIENISVKGKKIEMGGGA